MAVQFLADENFNNHLFRILRIRLPECDVIRAQDIGLAMTPDDVVLEWAAQADRVVLTHDADTMAGFAYDRVRMGQPMPGVIVIRSLDRSAQVVSDLILAASCGMAEDFRDLVVFLPF